MSIPNAAQNAARPATHYLITLIRSPIGMPEKTRTTLNSLGLYRRFQSVMKPFGPIAAGRILAVKELVSVRNVVKEDGLRGVRRRRPEGSGLEIAGRAFGGSKAASTTV